MQETDDISLLREYAERGSEEAFSLLVARHINKVYSVALRHTRNPHHAEEITQAVFVILAKKSRRWRQGVVLSGWLYQTARLTAMTFIRGEIRRARREREAYMQTVLNETETDVWPLIAPQLDAAMARLNETDRHAVVLRFFDGKSIKEVGAALGRSEEAAKMRLNRAVEKLRLFFIKRGIVLPAADLTNAISANSVQAAPKTLCPAVTAVVAKGLTTTASTSNLIKGALKIMAWSQAKTAVVATVIVLLAAAGTTSITVERAHERNVEKLWRINKTVSMAQIDRLPPLIEVLPTKFNSPWVNWNSGANGDKFVGVNARAGFIAAFAYGFPRGRIRFPAGEPTNRFDFIATLPQGSREALQRELRTKLGLIGHRETKPMDVLLLRVDHANAPGFKPAIPGANDEYEQAGVLHASDEMIATGAPRFEGMAYYLERRFGMPVIDETGLTQHFSVNLRWREESGHPNQNGLKQALQDQLGLELVKTNLPVDVLVMDNAR